jgi:hypothetical protein
MSGPGDIDGEVSGDEAAWRDIVAHYDAAAGPVAGAVPWPAREDLTDPAGSTPGRAADRTRVIRPSADGRQYGAADQTEAGQAAARPAPAGPAPAGPAPAGPAPAGPAAAGEDAEDEHYVPEPLPPAKLDPTAKAAWVAVICGPVYLLIGTFLQWNISGIAAFAAVAAFIGGFITLVVKLGDRPRRDDDDDGAVL